MNQAFVSWSGGKDCCLACYNAKAEGHRICYLASMITEHTGRLWPHYLTPDVLRMQAKAMDIPIVQRWTTIPDYKAEYIDMLSSLKQKGITLGVFGDVKNGNELADEHRKWVEEVCSASGMAASQPLWEKEREAILNEFIEAGFEAVIIASDKDRLGKQWLGRPLDRELIDELRARHKLAPDGDVGYYHTFVIDGPLFKRRLEILEANPVLKGPIWYLDILRCGFKEKVIAGSIKTGDREKTNSIDEKEVLP